MFLEIPDALTPAEVTRLKGLAASANFVDGRISSPNSPVKDNRQIDPRDRAHAESSALMAAALHRSEAFRGFASPATVAPPLLARYEPAMRYGVHSDAAFLRIGDRPLRSDLSCTVFIAAPAEYEGGELVIHLGARAVAIKGPAGSAVVYPSSLLHEVAPVTRGERLVGITFIESTIADPAHRELLWQLDEVAALEGYSMSWDNRVRLQHVRNNLRRMWSAAG